MKNYQLTLSILKPHIVQYPYALHRIKQIIEDTKLEIIKEKRIKFSKTEAAQFYQEHREKFFYNRLQTFMCRLVFIN